MKTLAALLLLAAAPGCNAVLSGVVPEILYFNFLGVWFTHSLWFPLGVTAILWFMNTVIAIHRNDPFAEGAPEAASIVIQQRELLSGAFAAVTEGADVQQVIEAAAALPLIVANSCADLIITLNFRTPVSSLLGVLMGATVVWAFQLPPLLDPEAWRVRKRLSTFLERGGITPLFTGASAAETRQRIAESPLWVFNASFARFIIGGVTAGIAGNFLLGNFQPEVSPAASIGIGTALMVFGLLLAIYTLIRWYKSDIPSDWMNFGYSIALVFFMILPAVYDFLLGIRPNQGWLFQLALAIVAILSALLSIRFFKNLNDLSRADLIARDVRYSRFETSTSRVWGRWLSLWIPASLIYFVAWIRDEQTQMPVEGKDETIGDVTQVLLAVALTAIVIIAFFLCAGCYRWRRPQTYAQWVDGEDQLDSYIVVQRDSDVGKALLQGATNASIVSAAAAAATANGAHTRATHSYGGHGAGQLTHRHTSSGTAGASLDALKVTK